MVVLFLIVIVVFGVELLKDFVFMFGFVVVKIVIVFVLLFVIG